ncbi:MAG TPA: gluconate 2-dehydrogenase subunit 3 family protein [Myxococcales bacterium]|nr:gluconate 2-dehydrogenase subunit 3 family protein [Myxococcales bacterium]
MRKRPPTPRSRKPREGEHNRRVFFQRLAVFGGGTYVLACKPTAKAPAAPAQTVRPGWIAKTLTSSHQTFTDAEYEVMSAAVERILPRDQDPGAIDVGVPVYIDRMLTSPELHEMHDVVLGGLAALEKRAEVSYHKRFPELAPEEQDKLLAEFRSAPDGSGRQHFFDMLFSLTMEGFFGDPSYGGNKNREGWALVNFDTSMPPGYDPMPGMKH